MEIAIKLYNTTTSSTFFVSSSVKINVFTELKHVIDRQVHAQCVYSNNNE